MRRPSPPVRGWILKRGLNDIQLDMHNVRHFCWLFFRWLHPATFYLPIRTNSKCTTLPFYLQIPHLYRLFSFLVLASLTNFRSTPGASLSPHTHTRALSHTVRARWQTCKTNARPLWKIGWMWQHNRKLVQRVWPIFWLHRQGSRNQG